MAWTVASLASGALCSFSESRPAWVAGTILAFGSEAVTLAAMRSILLQGMRAAPDAATRRLWIAISAVVAAVWVVIPLLWALGQAGILSMAAERVLFPPLDIISKVGSQDGALAVVAHVDALYYGRCCGYLCARGESGTVSHSR
jgi:bacteriorhodopsin